MQILKIKNLKKGDTVTWIEKTPFGKIINKKEKVVGFRINVFLKIALMTDGTEFIIDEK